MFYFGIFMRGWRNWQTRTAQDRVTERSYGFNSLPAHYIY